MRSLFVRMYVGIIVALVLAITAVVLMSTQRKPSPGPDGALPKDPFDSSAREIERLTQGQLWLIESQLRSQPRERWGAIIEAWQPHFDNHISLRPSSEILALDLSPRVRERLRAGQAAARLMSSVTFGDQLELILPLADSDQMVVQELWFGPSWEILLEFLVPEVTVLLVVLGVGVLLLTHPLYRHVTRLATTANAFGSGDLQARADTQVPEPIGHLARTFNDMAERIHRMSQEQQASLQAISHELRTPIARLHFALDIARQAQGPTDLQAQLAEMDKDVEELDQLVEELLIYTRLHRDAPPLEWEPIDLEALVTELIQQLTLFAPHLRIHLFAEGPLVCQGAPRHLRRALSNLIRNAQRYARAEVHIRLMKEESSYCILVDDDGPGVSPQDRERVFQPFTRLDDSRNRKTGGHGLGLAIVYRIMQAHHGSARLSDSPLGGARVILYWPQRQATDDDIP